MTQKVQAGEEFTCAQCGEVFTLSYARRGEPKYCSTSCAGEAQRSAESVECEVCGDQVMVDSYEAERNENHFCSRECFNEHQKSRVRLVCEVCGEPFEVIRSQAEDRVTCSQECLAVKQSEEFSRDGNPNFRDEVSTDELASEYEDGKSIPVLSEESGLSYPSVHDRLREAGVEMREPGWPKDVETSFGLSVRSSYEKQVAEMLHGSGVEFEYEPEDFPGPYIPDFVLEDGTVVEVWGVEGEEYDKRREKKEDWYASNNHDLVGVTP